ncbi:flavohemoprotein [Actinocatenispora thailandica]|uniref:nitric oxide dioxygenase n=1 Tax=Actinocatenispora thailandica TaxID=227318 RepID=A0A7R7DV87_9ACTN|nr:globin domain-containing protein [Actinocatenispora thailandica]BCJ38488.1 flavohemoprotein [Actinocatenispora thailandica]
MSGVAQTVARSWARIADRQDRVSAYFYARLFLAAPQLRDLFPIQLRPQRIKLVAAVGQAIAALDRPAEFDEPLRALGRAHRRFDVEPAYHDVFRECLIEAVRVHSGTDWNDATERAWRTGYDLIAARMNAGAAAEPSPPYRFAEVLTHDRRSAEVAVFTCRPAEPVRYRPGQYVPVETGHEPRVWRRYSMATAPRPDGVLEFHVRAVGAGVVSPALVWKLRPGEVIRLGRPAGDLSLPTGRDVVCLCGGTGVAPVRALVEAAPAGWERWVHLFVGARTEAGLYDLPALSELAACRPWLRLVPVVSHDTGYRGERGLLADVLARRGSWADHDFVLSGSPAMLRSTVAALRALGVPAARIQHDPYD